MGVLASAESALAIGSAELYTAESYYYGRFEARVRYAPGSGVVGSFFLWKDGSEVSGTFWNELDFEKLNADCHLVTNAFFGNPGAVHSQNAVLTQDLCGEFHTYKYEWTPESIAWFVDDVEVRRETGDTALAYAENATAGMQIRFNVWPGDASFGGVFDPSVVPVYQYIDWVQYSAYVDGAFEVEWREDFDAATLPSGWLTGSWGSPKNLSTHSPQNVGIVDGYAVLALTADDALGVEGASPDGPGAGTNTGSTGAAYGSYGEDPSACGCRVGPQRGGAVAATLLLGAVVANGLRRRRRPRRAHTRNLPM
ncbi:MAG TPA: family 16 glycosylhydrolase [Polyangiaceae bacterium]